jgi:hypothetical protein
MWTSAHIRKFVFNLPKGVIFSTRQLLNFGSRAAVDQCLCRLVKNGDIRRLAWGLFMRDYIDVPMPSAFLIATEKAKAFGKEIALAGTEAARLLGVVASGERKTTYAINGRSSSFKYQKMRIYFKGISARKFSLGDNPIGLAIKALWQLGKGKCQYKDIRLVSLNFHRAQRQQFRLSRHLMPTWLTCMLNTRAII